MNLNQKYIILAGSIILLIVTVFSLVIPILEVWVFLASSIFLFLFISLIFMVEAVYSTLKKNSINIERKAIKNPPKDQILFSTRSIFPFQVFPDRYILEENGLYIVKKLFFGMAWTEMFPIKDIATARLYSGPFFSSITIHFRMSLPVRSFQLRNLWKKDALRMKEILDGLILKQNQSINVPSNLPLEVKKKILHQEGREREVEKEI